MQLIEIAEENEKCPGCGAPLMQGQLVRVSEDNDVSCGDNCEADHLFERGIG